MGGDSTVPAIGDPEVQDAVLEDLSQAVNYRAWIASLVSPWLGERALEIGSGNGDLVRTLGDLGHRLTASEANLNRLRQLKARFGADPSVAVRQLTAPIAEESDYSSVFAVNVLEHIEDEVGALRSFRRLTRPGGHVIVFVPAFPWAMGRFDREIGHVRRYTKPTLTAALENADLTVERIHYVNPLGLLAWFLVVRVGRGRPRAGRLLRMFDGVVPALRALEAQMSPPFGQSLFAVARRPQSADD